MNHLIFGLWALFVLTACTDNNAVNVTKSANAGPAGTYEIPPDNSKIRDLTSVEFTKLMGSGINIGNTLEALDGQEPSETAWGNPKINQQLIDSIKAAGFKTIRLPVSWSKFTNADHYVIDPTWLGRVEEVINYILKADMFVIINMHWDNGWMQPTLAAQPEVNKRMRIMWKQIATQFRDYDDRVLFAGTNEIMVTDDYKTPTAEYYNVQNGFNQVFVDAVRATGGRNVYRQLVVQGFNTNIDHTVNFAKMPKDVVADRLSMEVHFYDPFQFTLDESKDSVYQWGNIATDINATAKWGNEDIVDTQFKKMKTHFIDKGVGVILGEYGAISRLNKDKDGIYRSYWNQYVSQSAAKHGLVPVYWDNGSTNDHNMGLFDRHTSKPVYPNIIRIIANPNP